MKSFIKLLMGDGRGPLVVTRSVKELLFEGYDDPLLRVLKANGNLDIPKVSFETFETRVLSIIDFVSASL
jgi:hypothetical protein